MNESKFGDIFYETNESLEAIIAGLQPKEGENILAICGSGEQANEINQKGTNVLAVDIDEKQLEYAMVSNCYKMDSINTTLNYKCGDIFDENFLPGEVFDSVYLSNALTYSLIQKVKAGDYKEDDVVGHFNFYNDSMDKISNHIKPGGKIYLSNELSIIFNLYNASGQTITFHDMQTREPFDVTFPKASCLDKFEIEDELTGLAQMIEEMASLDKPFDPVVLVRK